jgi:alkylation response protein AidB-like acyl-CoA dehydrogenase
MISFALEEDQQMIQGTVRKFAAEVLRPNLRAWERARGVPDEARRRIHELGLGLIEVPESLGGAGGSMLTAALVHEELAFGDPGAAVALWGPHLVPAALVELGHEAQARRLLARFVESPTALGAVAWSERGAVPLEGFATVAERRDGGFALTGRKAFVVNGGRADVMVVFAQLEPGRGWDGAGAFVVEKGAPGLAEGARHELLGLETVHAAEVTLDGCFVKDDDRLLVGAEFRENVKRFFARASLMNAARQVGLARAAWEYALAYTQERQAFGKPVAHFQAIAFTLAEMLMDVESARWLLWRAALGSDGKFDLARVAQAAVHANEAAWRVADHAVQLLGGAGYVQDHPVEKWLRDTKTLALFAPADQLAQLAAAGLALGAPVDAGLPSSAIQPVYT